jgi:ornithine cyclodeaminase
MPLLLTENDIRVLLPIDELIGAMRTALSGFSAGDVTQPLRTVIRVDDRPSYFGVMPALVAHPAALGAKLVTVFGANAAAGLPTHLATIVLLDPATGELMAILDGRYITEARTAAVSAVATDLLAREDAGSLALVGTGVQARSHLDAIGRVRRLRDVRIWSRDPEHCAAFLDDMQPRCEAPIMPVDSAREAVHQASLVVLATSSPVPVMRSEWIADGAHVCAVGACRPDQREMDGALVARSRLFVDSRSAALAEAGDVMLAIGEGLIDGGHIAGEIGEVVLGRISGRTSPNQVTIFKSLGLAVEDVAAAHLAYQRATERGLGRGFLL